MVVDFRQAHAKKRILDSIARADVRFDPEGETLFLQLQLVPGTIENDGLPMEVMDDFRVFLHHEADPFKRLECSAAWIDTEGSMFTARLHPCGGGYIESFIADFPLHHLSRVGCTVLAFGKVFRREFPNRFSVTEFEKRMILPLSERDEDSVL